MSALAGFWNLDSRPGAGDACARALSAQAIYGPHDPRIWDDGRIALGRSLLERLPEDRYDEQPLSGGGRYVLVADLRLDNREELIAALGIAPDRARESSDAAILLLAWERWQEASLDRLLGDYAFAVWDRIDRKLVMARDPFGMRPLHYHRGARFFALASMPKGLHALPDIPRAPDEERTTEIFSLYPEHGSRTFFKGIERVEVGHVLTVTAEGMASRKYWRPARTTLRLASADEYAEALCHHLDEAVRVRLRGAGTVGSHLSGGLDSSAVTATAARLLAPSGGKVVALTSVPREGFNGGHPPGQFTDEGPLAAATAALYPNVEHVLIRTDGRSPLENLDRNFFLFERPLINICNQVWHDALNDAARDRGLTVMLVGFMGNLGMSYDGLTRLPQLIAAGRWLRWLREARMLRRTGHSRKGIVAGSFGPWTPAAIWVWLKKLRGSINDVHHYTMVNPQRFRELDIETRARKAGWDFSVRPRVDGFATRLWALERVDMGNYIKGYLGGWGLDVRDPTTDRRLVEFCLSVPDAQFLADGIPRALARRAFADRLPGAVIREQRRGLQAADWHERLTAARAGLREEIERLAETELAAKSLDIQRMRRLVEDWPDSGWDREEIATAYRLALLRGVSSGHFLRKASGGNA